LKGAIPASVGLPRVQNGPEIFLQMALFWSKSSGRFNQTTTFGVCGKSDQAASSTILRFSKAWRACWSKSPQVGA